MQGNRLTELWVFAGITGVCGIAGMLGGLLIESLLAGVVIYTAWHLYRLASLPAIIRQERQTGAGLATGLWADVMQAIGTREQQRLSRDQELTQSLEHFRRTVETLPDAVVILQPDDVIEWSNSAADTLLGIPVGATGQRLATCLRDPIFDEYMQAGDFTRPLTMSAPAYRPVTLSLQIMDIAGDMPLRVIVARDISAQYHLNKSQRDFIANVSHELRTPLTVITGLLEQLEPEVVDSTNGTRIITIMQNQTQRMRDLISDLLALSRIEAAGEDSQEGVVAVAGLLATVIDEARTLGRDSGHVLLAEIQSGYGLRGNASELRTAFTNLVVNAVRHTPNRAEIRIHWEADRTGARFSVSDSGAGIPARHIPRLTERFYRVDSSRSRDTGGTGLGLSIVREVLDRHDATLEITSSIGHGSTFTCHFPPGRTVRLTAS